MKIKNETEEQDREQLHQIRVRGIVEYFNQLPDDARAQRKYEHLTEIMQGEGGNFSANVWITLLADFAIACGNIGVEPKMVLLNISREARALADRKMKEQGMTTSAPKGVRSN
jgi:hypothetical protein